MIKSSSHPLSSVLYAYWYSPFHLWIRQVSILIYQEEELIGGNQLRCMCIGFVSQCILHVMIWNKEYDGRRLKTYGILTPLIQSTRSANEADSAEEG